MKTYIQPNLRIASIAAAIFLLFIVDVEEAAAQESAEPAPAAELIPIGTVVTKLPDGCEPTPVDNVQYYHCGPNYYREAYQENNLVYVTTDPPK